MIVSSFGRYLPRTAHDHETAQNSRGREAAAAPLFRVIRGSAANRSAASNLAGPSRPAVLAGPGSHAASRASHAASPAVLAGLGVFLGFGEALAAGLDLGL